MKPNYRAVSSTHLRRLKEQIKSSRAYRARIIEARLQAGQSIRSIAKELGCNEKTVRLDIKKHAIRPKKTSSLPRKIPSPSSGTAPLQKTCSAPISFNGKGPSTDVHAVSVLLVEACKQCQLSPVFAKQVLEIVKDRVHGKPKKGQTRELSRKELVSMLNEQFPGNVPADLLERMHTLETWLFNWLTYFEGKIRQEALIKAVGHYKYWMYRPVDARAL